MSDNKRLDLMMDILSDKLIREKLKEMKEENTQEDITEEREVSDEKKPISKEDISAENIGECMQQVLDFIKELPFYRELVENLKTILNQKITGLTLQNGISEVSLTKTTPMGKNINIANKTIEGIIEELKNIINDMAEFSNEVQIYLRSTGSRAESIFTLLKEELLNEGVLQDMRSEFVDMYWKNDPKRVFNHYRLVSENASISLEMGYIVRGKKTLAEEILKTSLKYLDDTINEKRNHIYELISKISAITGTTLHWKYSADWHYPDYNPDYND